jgi:hypothetical protein
MRFRSVGSAVVALAALALVSFLTAQTAKIPDLKGISAGSGWTIVNRDVKVAELDGRAVATFDARPGDGMAQPDGVSFTTGEIECDIKGRSAPFQGSFVGLVFGLQGPGAFEAVYFRPFNFRSEDPARRGHSVQYIAFPDWNWDRLRQERPGQFERALEPAPDGDGWFHVRVAVGETKIEVFVDGAASPCLSVDRLAGPRKGAVALWVGNNSPGQFANLKITS